MNVIEFDVLTKELDYKESNYLDIYEVSLLRTKLEQNKGQVSLISGSNQTETCFKLNSPSNVEQCIDFNKLNELDLHYTNKFLKITGNGINTNSFLNILSPNVFQIKNNHVVFGGEQSDTHLKVNVANNIHINKFVRCSKLLVGTSSNLSNNHDINVDGEIYLVGNITFTSLTGNIPVRFFLDITPVQNGGTGTNISPSSGGFLKYDSSRMVTEQTNFALASHSHGSYFLSSSDIYSRLEFDSAYNSVGPKRAKTSQTANTTDLATQTGRAKRCIDGLSYQNPTLVQNNPGAYGLKNAIFINRADYSAVFYYGQIDFTRSFQLKTLIGPRILMNHNSIGSSVATILRSPTTAHRDCVFKQHTNNLGFHYNGTNFSIGQGTANTNRFYFEKGKDVVYTSSLFTNSTFVSHLGFGETFNPTIEYSTNSSSDARIKNIKSNYAEDMTIFFKQIRPVIYKMKYPSLSLHGDSYDSSNGNIGIIAQNLEDIDKRLVIDTDLKTPNYNLMTIYSMIVIKQLLEKIDKLRK